MIFQFVGLDCVEIWRMRALGRGYRYGVASAYEKARGLGPLRKQGGIGPVYDISQAELTVGSGEVRGLHGTPSLDVDNATLGLVVPTAGAEDRDDPLNVEAEESESGSADPSFNATSSISDDPAIDEVRHVLPEGWEPGGLVEQAPIAHAGFVAQVLEEWSEDESTTTSGVGEVRDLEDLDTEGSVKNGMSGEGSTVGPQSFPVAYRAVDGGPCCGLRRG